MKYAKIIIPLVVIAGGLRSMAVPRYVGPVAAEECRVRTGIGHVMEKIRQDKPITIGYFGGSITEMSGWRSLVNAWFVKQYPKCKLTEIQGAIGGTGSDLGVFRYGSDILKGKPDLVFVEFATNDANYSPETIWRDFDGIVRQTWRTNPDIDIIFVYTITQGMVSDYLSGFCPRAASAMEMLADHYGIPSVCFGPRVVKDVKSGKLVMTIGEVETAVPEETPNRDQVIIDELAAQGKILFSKDGTHPVSTGHEYYLASVVNAWSQMESLPPVNHAEKLSAAFYDPTLESAKLVPIEDFMLSGTWAQVDNTDPNKTFSYRFGSTPWLTETPGSKLTFRFKGSQCMIYDLLGPACGQLWITVDGVRRGPVARFDSYCTYYRLGCLNVYSGANGLHEVEIELDKNQPSRQSVAFRLANPTEELASDKYNGTEWYAGGILLVGDVDSAVMIDSKNDKSEPTEVPAVNVRAVGKRINVLGDKMLATDGVWQFDVWNGSRPTYDSLDEYLLKEKDEVRMRYLDWGAEFSISFDRDVNADEVCVYLKEGTAAWERRALERSLAEREVVAFGAQSGLTYRLLLDRVATTDIALQRLRRKSDALGATVELRLYERDPQGMRTGKSVAIAKCGCNMVARSRTSWFDANIVGYADWPEDAALANGGYWEPETGSLSEVASLARPGALDIDSPCALNFVAYDSKPVQMVKEAVFISDLEFLDYGLDSLPEIGPGDMSGIIVVFDGGGYSYYGMAQVGSRNAWVKLSGPSAKIDGCSVKVKIVLRKTDTGMTVGYNIDGLDYSYGGLVDIPVVADGDLHGASYLGCGTVRSLLASCDVARGLVLVVE